MGLIPGRGKDIVACKPESTSEKPATSIMETGHSSTLKIEALFDNDLPNLEDYCNLSDRYI
jgi:hypothetical protein